MKNSCFCLQLFLLGDLCCRKERQSEQLAPLSASILNLMLRVQLRSPIPRHSLLMQNPLSEELSPTKRIKKTSTKGDLKEILMETSVLRKTLRVTRKASPRAWRGLLQLLCRNRAACFHCLHFNSLCYYLDVQSVPCSP